MKIRSKNDKWLLMRKRNSERLDSILNEASRQINSSDPQDWGIYAAIYVGVTVFIFTLALDCAFEIVSSLW